MDERSSIAAARKGDKDAYRLLVEAHQDRVYGLVRSMVGSRAPAEDLTQEIFVKAYFALPRFKGDSAFFTWIFRIASNHCLDYLRRKPRPELPLDAPVSEAVPDTFAETFEAPPAERPDYGIENDASLAELLDQIDPEQKLILVLRELEGHTYEELSALLKCPINTVKSRLNRAREALKAAYVRLHGNIAGAETVQSLEKTL